MDTLTQIYNWLVTEYNWILLVIVIFLAGGTYIGTKSKFAAVIVAIAVIIWYFSIKN